MPFYTIHKTQEFILNPLIFYSFKKLRCPTAYRLGVHTQNKMYHISVAAKAILLKLWVLDEEKKKTLLLCGPKESGKSVCVNALSKSLQTIQWTQERIPESLVVGVEGNFSTVFESSPFNENVGATKTIIMITVENEVKELPDQLAKLLNADVMYFEHYK